MATFQRDISSPNTMTSVGITKTSLKMNSSNISFFLNAGENKKTSMVCNIKIFVCTRSDSVLNNQEPLGLGRI